MELNREQIIKALECCTKDDCDNCPNTFGNCYSNLAGMALAIIREQDERIAAFVIMLNKAYEFCKKAKADTVRMMQEMLKATAVGFPEGTQFVAVGNIDQIAKELLEEAK